MSADVAITRSDRQPDALLRTPAPAGVGPVRVVKTESKGKGNKRVRIAVEDA